MFISHITKGSIGMGDGYIICVTYVNTPPGRPKTAL